MVKTSEFSELCILLFCLFEYQCIRFYYTSQYLHNKTGISQSIFIKFLGYLYMINTSCDFVYIYSYLNNIDNNLFWRKHTV